jgi:hypothetical protein
MASFSRAVTSGEVEAFADGADSLEHFEVAVGIVSESGRYVTENRRRLQILVICGLCGRTWWTVQRGIVSGWFEHFEMRPPQALADLYAA